MKSLKEYVIYEKMTKSKLKNILTGKLADNDEYEELEKEQEKLYSHYRDMIDKVVRSHDFEKVSKLEIEFNKKKEEIKKKFDDFFSAERESKSKLLSNICNTLYYIKKYIKDGSDTITKDSIDYIRNMFGNDGVYEILIKPHVTLLIDFLWNKVNPAIDEYIKKHDDSIIDDIKSVVKMLKMDNLVEFEKNNHLYYSESGAKIIIDTFAKMKNYDVEELDDLLNDTDSSIKKVEPKK